MRITLDEGAIMPTRAHSTDAGLDLYSRETKPVLPGFGEVFDTGVHIELPKGYWGKLESKSGLNVNFDIVSCGGTIDEGYTGSIKVKLYNLGSTRYMVQKGQKIVQMIILPYSAPELELVDALPETERGNNGFGSTGI